MAAFASIWPFNRAGGASDVSTPKDEKETTTTSRDSTFPVELPVDAALHLSNAPFGAYVQELLRAAKAEKDVQESRTLFELLDLSTLDTSVFDDALQHAHAATESTTLPPPNMTRTENDAPAFVSTQSDLLDLFVELEKTIGGERLETLLDKAWDTDALATLKIMWNARSIHLGKGEHESFYRCLGWLFQNHPATLLANLPLLYRRVIAKKAPTTKDKDEEEADAMVVVGDDPDDADGPAVPELRFGVSHGYWKDLLNVLVLAVRDRLTASADPREVLNEPNANVPRRKQTLEQRRKQVALRRKERGAKATSAGGNASAEIAATTKGMSPAQLRHAKEEALYRRAVARFMDPGYRALHLTVARLFAAQLSKDRHLLAATDPQARRHISLAAKWAPSLEKFHDKQTGIASSIAEALFPTAATCGGDVDVRAGETPRTAYVRCARERYRAEVLAPLRRHLAVVERAISAEAIHTIDYSAVPSVAMHRYKDLFALKDFERFFAHVQRAQSGTDPTARISGAVLQPAVLVAEARGARVQRRTTTTTGAAAAISRKRAELGALTLDAQWRTLVQRVRDAGALPATIAVADVSGSMTAPTFPDRTTPLDTAIGLALLVAEVVPAPFGGRFITFSHTPEIVAAGGPGDPRPFAAKVDAMERADWEMNTDFNAVFEKLLLPLALEHRVAPAEMVQTIVVLSDMQFDAAESRNRASDRSWETNHERLRRLFATHGYELPRLVYWNLRANAGSKPVTKDTENALLVSGYSQGMLRTFMEDGGFDLDEEEPDADEADVEEIKVAEDGSLTVQQPVKKTRKTDPMAGLRKAIAHAAYDGLRVVD